MTTALLVVDVQREVVDEVASRDEVVPVIAELVSSARAAGRPVVWVQHADEDLPRGSAGWRFVPELEPRGGEPVVQKRFRSAFADTGLAGVLRDLGVTRLAVTGAQSAFCVDMAGKHALAEGFDVALVSDGHCNGDLDTAEGSVPDSVIRALTNRAWQSLRHPGRRVEVVDAASLQW